MKIFISWSGRRSHEVAAILGPWLRKNIQSVDFFLSSDMERGTRWLDVITDSLDAHSLGIICVTPGNVNAPWINFEAGALSKHLGDEGRVIPFLLDFPTLNDLKPPLSQFNAALADENGTWQIIKTLNEHAEFKQTEVNLRENFDVWWPKLEEKLTSIKNSVSAPPPERRTDKDKLDELLTAVREMQREISSLRNASTHDRTSGGFVDGTGRRIGPAALAVRTARGEPVFVETLGGLQQVTFSTDALATTMGAAVESASDVVGMIMRQQGLDPSATRLLKLDGQRIEILIPHSLHYSVPDKIRSALKTTMPMITYVDFFQKGDGNRIFPLDLDPLHAKREEYLREEIDSDFMADIASEVNDGQRDSVPGSSED